MKRCIIILALIAAMFSFAACGNQENTNVNANADALKHHEIITDAVKLMQKHWQESYKNSKYDNSDGYFEIKNTRVVTVKDNDLDMFKDIAYIIEFELFTDYMCSAPYYENVGINDNVVIYKNGEMKVESKLIQLYRGRTFQSDFSDFIEASDDYNGQYNTVKKLK